MVAILDLSVFYLVESPGGSYRDSTEWGFSCDIFSVCKHLMWRNLYLSKLFSKKKKKTNDIPITTTIMFKKRKFNNAQKPVRLAEQKEALSKDLLDTDSASPVVVKKQKTRDQVDSTQKKKQDLESTPEPLPSKEAEPTVNSKEGDHSDAEPVEDEAEKSNLGVFNGKMNVAKFINMPKDGAAKGKFGPLKASAHIRSTTMTDYAPDVCKDYKQSGFCGFGDTCKFLHIREDYAAGWKLDREWELKQEKKPDIETVETPTDAAYVVPSTCPICSQPYKFPVVTSCGHFFCERCFLAEFKKKPVCVVCGAKVASTVKPAQKQLKERLSAQESAGSTGS